MAQYDEKVLAEGANRLLQQAEEIIRATAAKFGGVTFFFVAICSYAASAGKLIDPAYIPVLCIAFGAIGTAVGFSEGKRRAFELRLEAHKLLALIEVHQQTSQRVFERA